MSVLVSKGEVTTFYIFGGWGVGRVNPHSILAGDWYTILLDYAHWYTTFTGSSTHAASHRSTQHDTYIHTNGRCHCIHSMVVLVMIKQDYKNHKVHTIPFTRNDKILMAIVIIGMFATTFTH